MFIFPQMLFLCSFEFKVKIKPLLHRSNTFLVNPNQKLNFELGFVDLHFEKKLKVDFGKRSVIESLLFITKKFIFRK